MDPTIVVAICSLLGTFIGSFSGIQLVKYRLQQLEEKTVSKDELAVIRTELAGYSKKVEKHNQLIERTYILEGKVNIIEKDLDKIKEK